ncbi:MAG TPA: molybdenum ABC transporter ATP-binding protein [Gammaproteobacteria bacterium]|nr:molybdenum ABC transporter ATP-binding protein [Gammaproteobacteria bacterium]
MLSLDFTARRGDFTLEIAAELPARGITGVFGRSGAGKSTLIDSIAGVARPLRGRIALDDAVFVDIARRHWTPIEARRVGYVFQDAKLFPHLRVISNLRYGLRRAREAASGADWERVIEVMDLAALLQRWPNSLSGGERQRVAIARALLARPRLMLMDEPLASLDAPRKAEILHYLERLRDEYPLPVIYVSHSVDELVRVADHLLVLAGGRVLACGPFLELVADARLQPQLGRFEAGSVVECTVEAHDEALELSTLVFTGGRLRVPRLAVAIGTRLRARLRARDVALATRDPPDLSITNRVHGRIVELVARDGPYVDVVVDAAGTRLHALVTRESCARLALAPGRAVVALIKAVALDSRTVGYQRRAREDVEG